MIYDIAHGPRGNPWAWRFRLLCYMALGLLIGVSLAMFVVAETISLPRPPDATVQH